MRPLIIAILVMLPLLASCQSAPTPVAEPDEAEKAAAEAKLEQMLAHKQKLAEFGEKQRQIEAEREAQRQAEASRPHYAPARVAAAARPRTWGHITVPDLNVDAVFNSTWKDDHLNYRVALLGQRSAINTFMSQHRTYGLNFANQAGTVIFEFPLSPEAFSWDAPNFNGGIPTMETNGTIECDLDTYEQAVQWNLTWGG